MALENFSSGKIYLQIADGKLVQSFKEPREGAKERINKNGRQVFEIQHDAIIGKITGIQKRENDYGIFLEILINDRSDDYQISTQFSGRYSSSFLKALPNINLQANVRLSPWSMIDKNDPTKKVTGITLYQEDGNGWVKVAPYYTKGDPKGLPQMVKIKIKGKETWDDTDMMSHLFEAGQKHIAKPATAPEKPLKKGEMHITESVSGDDDLPF